jgi:hypothetical protein
MQKRLVAKNLGTTVNMMDAQAQALQEAQSLQDDSGSDSKTGSEE